MRCRRCFWVGRYGIDHLSQRVIGDRFLSEHANFRASGQGWRLGDRRGHVDRPNHVRRGRRLATEELIGWTERTKERLGGLLEIPEEGASPLRYKVLRRNITVLMLLITIIPLVLMAGINYYQYQSALKDEIASPMRLLVNKAKHSFELFLAGRLSTVRFISSAYTYDQLADEKNLNRVFRVLKQEFRGFVDLGLIDAQGLQVSYAGPYELKGKNYADQSWFQQVMVKGVYISDVFMGHRRFPHVAIAVQHLTDRGEVWVVRATIDTAIFDELIAAMGLDARSDAFLINRDGELQTSSKFFGKTLEKYPFVVPPVSHEPAVFFETDSKGRVLMVTYANFAQSDFVLMLVRPQSDVLKTWYTLKVELLVVFVIGVTLIVILVLRMTNVLIKRMKESDEKRELAYREMQHSHKLSYIGRLAAGVAH